MPPYQRRLFGLLGKVESTYGTDPTPAPAVDGIRLLEAFEPRIEHAFPNRREDAASGTLGMARPAPMRGRTITFEGVAEVKGSRATTAYSATNLPPVSPLLRAAGWSETVDTSVGTEKVTYTPADGTHSSATLWYYWGGKLYKAVGCRVDGRFLLQPGQQARFEFTAQGLLGVDPTETALASITSYGAAVAPTAVALALAIGAWNPDRYDELVVALGAQVQRNDGGNAPDGIAAFDISDHLPTASLRALLVELASYNPYADSRDAVSRAIAFTLGSVQYNRVDFSLPIAYVRDPGHAERNRFAGVDLEYDAPFEPADSRPTIVFD